MKLNLEERGMGSEREKSVVMHLREAYLSLVRACIDCNMADAQERRTLFRLKEEVFCVYMKKYTEYQKISCTE